MEKLLEKNVPTVILEKQMNFYKSMILDFDKMPKERVAFFISVSFSKVIDSFKEKA